MKNITCILIVILLGGCCPWTKPCPPIVTADQQRDAWTTDLCICSTYQDPDMYVDYYDPDNLTVCASNEQEAIAKLEGACLYYAEQKRQESGLSYSTDLYACKAQNPHSTNQRSCTQVGTNKSALISARPSFATFDGLVDFGQSYMQIDIPSEDETTKENIMGEITLVGGNCPNNQCSFDLWYAKLEPVNHSVTTNKGRVFSNLVVQNHGVWSGTKNADDTLQIDQGSKVSITGLVDGEYQLYVFDAAEYVRGNINRVVRLKGNNTSSLENSIIIDGDFNSGDVWIHLHIVIWLAHCNPTVSASASCQPPIDTGGDPYILFKSDGNVLDNMHSQDLCNALNAPDYKTVCLSGLYDEFPWFRCQETSIPQPLDYWEKAKLLQYVWKDGDGVIISDQPLFPLNYMPKFPVTLVVTNKWGKEISYTIYNPPTGICPATPNK